MKIGTCEVGPGHPPFIVAEGGSNHGGSLDAALALTDAAADAGADAMKWQLWFPDEMYEKDTAEYESAVKWRLNDLWLPDLQRRAHQRGMAFGLSSFGMRALDVADVWVDFHKVASIEATWGPFVQAVYEKRKPTFISLGMMDRQDISNLFRVAPNAIVLQCTVAYPAAIEDANIRDLPELSGLFAGVGLSDHTTHPTIAPCAAVALGACAIEKHLRGGVFPGAAYTTSAAPLNGVPPDWAHSIGPKDFAAMVSAVRLTEKALGSSEKRIRPSEEPYLKYRRGPRGLRGA